MRSMRPSVLATVLLVFALAVSSSQGDDAKEVFDALFGAKLNAASGTADRSDDIALANEMVTLAKAKANQTDLLVLLCNSAHDLGLRHPDGYATAAEAMRLLADTVSESRADAREKLLAVLTRQSVSGKPDEREGAAESLVALLVATGDEKVAQGEYFAASADYRRAYALAMQKRIAADDVKGKLEFALGRDRTMKQIARLQEKLLADANDNATAEEIVKLYVVELDDPATAVRYLNRVSDENLKRLVPSASKPLNETSEDEAAALGEWYRSLAMDTKPSQPQHALSRAKSYLSRFLELHRDNDLKRTKAEGILKEVDKALAALAPADAPAASTFIMGSPENELGRRHYDGPTLSVSTIRCMEMLSLRVPYERFD